MKRIVVICGATASGKSDLALALAQKLGGEIICADSMQIYRGMDIGTAKPTPEDRAAVPHHMTDMIHPWETYSVSRYETEAAAATEDVLARGRVPVVCGGTGLYINALIRGAGFMEAGDPAVRARLEAQWQEGGGAPLMAALKRVDAESAARLHANDKKRVIRALEVYETTGMTISQHNAKTNAAPPRYQALMLAPNPEERQELYRRIDLRVHRMLAAGLEEEVHALWSAGELQGTAAQAIGYKELIDRFEGRCSLAEAAEAIQQKSRNYAKRQLSWFRADERVRWLVYKQYDLTQLLLFATNYLSDFGYN